MHSMTFCNDISILVFISFVVHIAHLSDMNIINKESSRQQANGKLKTSKNNSRLV